MQTILTKMGYVKGEPQHYLFNRVCGIWLLWVSAVILLGLLFGGKQKINMPLFDFGYFLGVFFILANKRIYRKFAYGKPSQFQKNMMVFSFILMFVLLIGLGGWYFPSQNFRMIWLMAFLAIGIHFYPFSFVHGKTMLFLATALSLNAIIGILSPSTSFSIFAYTDAAIKVLFGIILTLSKNPNEIGLAQTEKGVYRDESKSF